MMYSLRNTHTAKEFDGCYSLFMKCDVEVDARSTQSERFLKPMVSSYFPWLWVKNWKPFS